MQDELGILREVGSIAAGHGSIALSEILGKRISLYMPTVDIASCATLSSRVDLEKMGIAVVSKLPTGLKGEAIFLLDEKNAFKLVDISCNIREEDKKSGVLTEVGISSLKEIGSIVIGSYLSAISLMLKKVVLSLPPTLISGTIDDILNIIIAISGANDYVIFVEAVFKEPEEDIKGGFYLVLTPTAAADVIKACKKMLRDLEKEKNSHKKK